MSYLSRGVEHQGGSRSHLNGWSEREKDRLASLLLGVVELALREPTGAGHIDSDVREFVMKRSA